MRSLGCFGLLTFIQYLFMLSPFVCQVACEQRCADLYRFFSRWLILHSRPVTFHLDIVLFGLMCVKVRSVRCAALQALWTFSECLQSLSAAAAGVLSRWVGALSIRSLVTLKSPRRRSGLGRPESCHRPLS